MNMVELDNMGMRIANKRWDDKNSDNARCNRSTSMMECVVRKKREMGVMKSTMVRSSAPAPAWVRSRSQQDVLG